MSIPYLWWVVHPGIDRDSDPLKENEEAEEAKDKDDDDDEIDGILGDGLFIY